MAEEPAPATQEATNGGPGQPAGAKGNFRGSGADGSRGGGRRGRGRGRGRAGGERSGGDRRPGGRGRAGNLGGQSSTAPMAPGTQNRLDQAAAQATAATGEAAEDEIDDSVCFICANPVTYYSIGPCGHSTCHICSLRMRALYNTKACAHCRVNHPLFHRKIVLQLNYRLQTEAEYVIFAADEEKKYDQYSDADFVQTDVNLGIKYTTEAINQDTLLLLRYNCPEPTCDVQCHGWKALHAHVRAAHNQYLW